MKAWALIYFAILTCVSGHADLPVFQGVADTDVQKIRRENPSLIEGELSLEKVDQWIRHLSLVGTYERIYAEELSDGRIQIVARSLRTIQQILVTGQNAFGESTLKDVIGLSAGKRFERKLAIEAGERLKNFYGEQGYFNTVVELQFLKESSSQVTIQFTVKEGEPCRIQEISVESENSELADRVSTITNRLKRKILTTERIEDFQKQVNSFLQTHRYLHSQFQGPEITYGDAQRTTARLRFTLQDPYRYEFIVHGAESLNDMEVYRLLNLSSIEVGTPDPLTEAVERLRLGYLKMGYPNVNVEGNLVEMKDAYLRRAGLEVQENSRVRVEDLILTGRFSRPQEYYRNFIKQNSSDLIALGFYNRADLELGFENLVTELRNQGYLKAKVQSSRLEYSAQSTASARVVVLLDEGPLTQIRSVAFSGNVSFPADQLNHALTIKPNTPLHLIDLENSLAELKNFYHQQGYLEMKVLNEGEALIEYNDRNTQANIRFEISEGPKVFAHLIRIEGNSFTQSEVITRAIDIHEGDILTPESIENSEIKLNRLGLFSRATIRTLEEGSNISQRTVVISVAEADPGTLRLGAGVNSERELTARGFIGLGYNNLGGTGRGVSARAEVKSHVIKLNYPQYEIVAGYTEPFLFNTQTRGQVNLTRSERIFAYDSISGRTSITASNKIDLLLERDFPKHTRLTWKLWSMDSRKEFERNGFCLSGDTSQKCDPTVLQIATMGPVLDLDYTDSFLLPTRGHRSQWTLDYSNPVFGSSSGVEFVRTEAAHTRYLPIRSNKVVWANGVRGGYLSNLSRTNGSGVPSSYAFFLGGQSTLRGFGGSDANERLPNGTEFPIEQGNQRIIELDSHYFLVKSELRFPLVGDHNAAVFYDGGYIQVSGFHFKRPYRDAIGIGYRYLTPVGPLNIDMAFKISPDTAVESPWRVHFSIGTF